MGVNTLLKEHECHENKANDHQVKKLLIVEQNSPCQHLKKCIEDSWENMNNNVRVSRVYAMETRICVGHIGFLVNRLTLD